MVDERGAPLREGRGEAKSWIRPGFRRQARTWRVGVVITEDDPMYGPATISVDSWLAFTNRRDSTVHEHPEIFVALSVFAGLDICFTVEPLDRLLKWREFS